MDRKATLYSNTLTIAANGNSDPFSVDDVDSLWIAVFPAGVSGTTPTLNVVLEQQDAHGNWLPVSGVGAQLTSAPNYTTAHIGLVSNHVLLSQCRLAWAVTGTDPSWTGVKLSVMGRA